MEMKQKSWFRRHWILTAVICFIIFFIILGVILDQSTPSNNPPSANNVESAPKPETQIFSIGQKIAISDIKYTVDEAATALTIGSEYINEEADGIFVIISLTVENDRNREIFLSSNDFKLKDSQDRRYNADNSAGMYLNTMGYNAFMFKTLGAGLKTSGEVIFDVPADDKGLVLEISGEGLFSDKAYVNIGEI